MQALQAGGVRSDYVPYSDCRVGYIFPLEVLCDMIEKQVKSEVKKILKEFDVWWYMPVPTGFSRAGVPDFIVCHRGRFLGIETKAPNRRGEKNGGLSLIQMKTKQDIERAGGTFMVYDGGEDHKELLREWIVCQI